MRWFLVATSCPRLTFVADHDIWVIVRPPVIQPIYIILCQCPAALHADTIYQAGAALLLQAFLCCHLLCPPIWGLRQDLQTSPQLVSMLSAKSRACEPTLMQERSA